MKNLQRRKERDGTSNTARGVTRSSVADTSKGRHEQAEIASKLILAPREPHMHPKVVAEIHQATFSLAFSSRDTKASPRGSFTLDILLKRSQIPLVRVLATQRGQSPLGWKLPNLGAIAWPAQVGSNGCVNKCRFSCQDGMLHAFTGIMKDVRALSNQRCRSSARLFPMLCSFETSSKALKSRKKRA